MLLVYPGNPSRKESVGDISSLLTDSLSDSYSASRECDYCSLPNFEPIRSHLSNLGTLLALNIVWPSFEITTAEPSHVSSRSQSSSRRFQIRTTFDLTSLMAQPRLYNAAQASLVGVLYRVGTEVAQNHCVSYIFENECCRRIDDN